MYITELPVMCCSILSVFVVNGKKKKRLLFIFWSFIKTHLSSHLWEYFPYMPLIVKSGSQILVHGNRKPVVSFRIDLPVKLSCWLNVGFCVCMYTKDFLILVFQIIRFHAGALPVYVVSNILLTYGGQLSTLMSTGSFLEKYFF